MTESPTSRVNELLTNTRQDQLILCYLRRRALQRPARLRPGPRRSFWPTSFAAHQSPGTAMAAKISVLGAEYGTR